MHKLIGFGLLLLLIDPGLVFSSPSTLKDSLVAEKHPQLELSRRWSERDPEEALRLARKVLNQAEDQNNAVLEAHARHCVGIAQRKAGRYRSGIEEIERSIVIFKANELLKDEANSYNTLGLIASDQARYVKALGYHLMALSIRREINDLPGLAYSYNNLGNNYRNSGDFESSLKYHLLAVDIKMELDDRGSLSFSYHNLGHTYRRMGDFTKAREYYELGLEIRRELNLQSGVASSLNSIGVLLETGGHNQEALEHFQASLELRRELGDKKSEAGSMNNVAGSLRKQGKFTEALAYLFQSKNLTEAIDTPFIHNETLLFISNVYRDMGQFEKALEFHSRYSDAHELLFNKSNSKQLMEIQVEFETREKELEIRHLLSGSEIEKNRKDQQFRFLLILAAVFIAFFFLLIHRYIYTKRSRNLFQKLSQDLEIKGSQLAEANAELARLARSDALTGLVNRRGFDEHMEKDWALAMRNSQPLSLLMIDVDYFKDYNDAFGHLSGDQCLHQLAQVFLHEASRPEDTVCRYGGEEFAIILGDTSRKGAQAVAEKLRAATEATKIVTPPEAVFPYLTVSVGGCTMVPSSESSLEDMIQKADLAMYQAKRNGRNGVVF